MAKGIKLLSLATLTLTVLFTCFVVAVCAYFPNKYAREINAAAARYELDPALVRAVVWAESRFDGKAVSKAGAAGLMQLMPQTFAECAERLGKKNANAFDVRDSLDCGCYYLSTLLDKFGDRTAALYAYNAGEVNAGRFLSGEAEVFPQTRAYVAAVDKAYGFYGFFTSNNA